MVVVEGLRKSFGRVEALKGASFYVKAGRITALLGANGAGKTTSLKVILGFLRPDAGGLERRFERAGYVPEHPAFFPFLKGSGVLGLTFRSRGVAASREQERLVERYAERLNFDPALLRRPPVTYSSGTAKKFAYLQSLVIEPDLLVADEPFSALDPPSIKAARELFLELRGRGVTLLLSSHLLGEMQRVADDAVIIKQGRVAAQFSLNGGRYIDLETEFLRLAGEG
jgi:ABC-2 type transport system ATP-binding protein